MGGYYSIKSLNKRTPISLHQLGALLQYVPLGVWRSVARAALSEGRAKVEERLEERKTRGVRSVAPAIFISARS